MLSIFAKSMKLSHRKKPWGSVGRIEPRAKMTGNGDSLTMSQASPVSGLGVWELIKPSPSLCSDEDTDAQEGYGLWSRSLND